MLPLGGVHIRCRARRADAYRRWTSPHTTPRNARLTCRPFGISSATFYRWWHRSDPRRLARLEDERRTRRPHRVRQPQTAPALVTRIRALREQYPRGQAQAGRPAPPGRLGRLRFDCRPHPHTAAPPRAAGRTGCGAGDSTRASARPPVLRTPQALGYVPQWPGDLVELDATLIEVLPGLRRAHFTARDVISRKDILAVHDRQSSAMAERVLAEDFPRFGFPVRAIQIDGGSPRSSPNIGGSCAPGRTRTTTSVPTRLWAISLRMNFSVASIREKGGKCFESTGPVHTLDTLADPMLGWPWFSHLKMAKKGRR